MNCKRKKLILVSGSSADLISMRSIVKPRYKAYPALSAAKLFDIMENIHPDLIIIDFDMQGSNAQKAIAKLKADVRYNKIPIIILASEEAHQNVIRECGLFTADCLVKPIITPMLLLRIEERLLPLRQESETYRLMGKIPAWVY
jgi:DNA-binding response OmpR family regulator